MRPKSDRSARPITRHKPTPHHHEFTPKYLQMTPENCQFFTRQTRPIANAPAENIPLIHPSTLNSSKRTQAKTKKCENEQSNLVPFPDSPFRSNLSMMPAEQQRLLETARRDKHWRCWGPDLAERSWGVPREDYSPNGAAWDSFTFDDAHVRACRWTGRVPREGRRRELAGADGSILYRSSTPIVLAMSFMDNALDRTEAADSCLNDVIAACPEMAMASLHATGHRAYIHQFDREIPGQGQEALGSFHGLETPYVFGTLRRSHRSTHVFLRSSRGIEAPGAQPAGILRCGISVI